MRKGCWLIAVTGIIIAVSCGQPAKNKEEGKALYATYCQGCHMEDGKGVPNMNAPLIGSAYVTGDKNKLVHIVLEGSAAFANDPPRGYKNIMGPIAGLTDQQIADILTYVRSSFGNEASEVTVGDVKTAREKK